MFQIQILKEENKLWDKFTYVSLNKNNFGSEKKKVIRYVVDDIKRLLFVFF